jgi:hypothetical protein
MAAAAAERDTGESALTHCDDLIDAPDTPEPLREFLAFHRQPAIGKRGDGPMLFATIKHTSETRFSAGNRVRVVMASRFGDVGITTDLSAVRGYMARVSLDWLKDFSKGPAMEDKKP